MPFLGRSEQSTALEGLTPVGDIPASVDEPGRAGWSNQQLSAALALAARATDRDDLRILLDMCGLLGRTQPAA